MLEKPLIGRASTLGFSFVNQCLSGPHSASHILGESRPAVGPHQEHGIVVARQQFYGVAMVIETENFPDGVTCTRPRRISIASSQHDMALIAN